MLNKKEIVFINCKNCNEQCEKRSAVQKYCLKCSELMNLKRMNMTSEQALEYSTKKGKERKELYHVRGKKNSELFHEKWENYNKNTTWYSMIEMPFTWDFSKNRIYSLGRKTGHVFIRNEVRAAKLDLQKRVERIKDDREIFRGKVWLDILVEKPNNKGDAVNFVDSICDAVKIGLGIDDRYFSLGCVDWRIKKVEPKIFVVVRQTITEHHFYCMYCGRCQKETTKKTKKDICKECLYGYSPETQFDLFEEKL